MRTTMTFAAIAALCLITSTGAQGQQKALKAVEDFNVLVQISGNVDVLEAYLSADEPDLPWTCRCAMRKVAPDLWAGVLVAPVTANRDALQVRLDVLRRTADELRWVCLPRTLGNLMVKADEILDTNAKARRIPFANLLIEYALDNDKTRDRTVNQVTGWLLREGPQATALKSLGNGRWLGAGKAYWNEQNEYSALSVEIEFVAKDGTKTSTGWKSIKELGGKVLYTSLEP